MKPKLLLIDDDPAGLLALSEAVRSRLDVIIDLAKSAEAALKLIDNQSYDVIVCDVVMPRLDGFDLLKAAREIWPNSVIVLVTGRALKSEERALTHGAHAFLTKPIDPDRLVRVIAEAIQEARLINRVRASNARSFLNARLKGVLRNGPPDASGQP